MFNKVLVVCVGNICRSPTGEYLLKQRLPKHEIASAGVGALVDKPADPQAQAVAQQHGVDLSPHIARQLTPEIAAQYDLILVMEQGHIDAVSKISPSARSKTMLFGQWLPQGRRDIADPYRQSDEMFQIVYTQLKQAADLWAEKLKQA
ncbi:low molecular weight protein-tyrosine-phosphatase [Alysiella crassa]|uniref:protein-tyrosine-phosphatase n=1 Tax=Alysiella crassa TaxID=153491 RepID=A0A376BVD0_9NEIS|nr:low molecular weight protein-tyrosine-phosphatase [Alysiella crassa]UOP06437.1 low molecular weight phosphotyrosine protein phosphatase [Alysiella crassa]SSY80962.1 Low molecular weight protein-tyrosine-phosphatase etp [Alysiella crassa]